MTAKELKALDRMFHDMMAVRRFVDVTGSNIIPRELLDEDRYEAELRQRQSHS